MGTMRTLTQEQLKEILEKHQLWLNNEPGGKRADLSRCDLSYADLSHADMSYADMNHADMSDVDMSYADMNHADMSYAVLSCADMRHAKMSYAVLSCADMRHAVLCYANLYHADMRHANLSYADLYRADLSRADLYRADLYHADMRHANLRCADMSDAKNIPFIPLACPGDGAFIGWKKVKDYIIKLEIPENARRSSATSNKCRCEYAKVLEIQNRDGTKANVEQVDNLSYSPTVRYTIGKMVYPDSYDEDRWNECSHGIHFFINRQDAVEY